MYGLNHVFGMLTLHEIRAIAELIENRVEQRKTDVLLARKTYRSHPIIITNSNGFGFRRPPPLPLWVIGSYALWAFCKIPVLTKWINLSPKSGDRFKTILFRCDKFNSISMVDFCKWLMGSGCRGWNSKRAINFKKIDWLCSIIVSANPWRKQSDELVMHETDGGMFDFFEKKSMKFIESSVCDSWMANHRTCFVQWFQISERASIIPDWRRRKKKSRTISSGGRINPFEMRNHASEMK